MSYELFRYFKTNLKNLRLEKRVSQLELSKKLSLSNGAISLWEKGLREPNMYALIILANFFGVSIDYLVGLEN